MSRIDEVRAGLRKIETKIDALHAEADALELELERLSAVEAIARVEASKYFAQTGRLPRGQTTDRFVGEAVGNG